MRPTATRPRVLFYISGHGYGHARRMAAVIRALRAIAPELDVHVRTTAPPRIFAGLVPADQLQSCRVDAGAAERSPMEIDAEGTLQRIAAALARRDAVVAEELPVVRELSPALIVSDAPFLAGEVALAAGVPCVAMTNFSWDWIVEPFLSDRPEHRDLLAGIRQGYAKMEGVLRMPLGGTSDAFRWTRDVPLVANRSAMEPGEVLQRLGIDQNDDRPRVLFGVRGAIPTQVLATAANESREFLFLCPTNEPGEVPPGVIPAPLDDALDFSDVLKVSDVVVGKMGYGLISECIVSGARLLWPRRHGFREDDVVEREGPHVMRMRELPTEDFHRGAWREHLRAAMELPAPVEVMPSDGAEECAKWIADRCAGA